MKKLFGVLLIGVIISCNNIGVTKTEAQAVQSVLNFYGGMCIRHKGFSSGNGETKKYFELEMSKSKLIESYSNIPEMPASNIAYIFYTNLNGEREKYTHIKVKINLSGGQSHEYCYSTTDLKEIESLTPVLKTASEKIEKQDYNGLLSLFDTVLAPDLTVEELKAYCTPYDSAYGRAKEIQFQGYAYFNFAQDNQVLAHLMGAMIRETKNTPISLFIDRKTKKILTMKYEL